MKKILFLGEYSGLYTNLKKGLLDEDGEYEVIVVANGDGFKNLKVDVVWGLNGTSNMVNKVCNKLIKGIEVLNLVKKCDVIMIINPEFFRFPLGNIYFGIVKKLNKNLYLTCAGDDAIYIKNCKKNFRYYPYYDFNKKDIPWSSEKEMKLNLQVARGCKKLIPNLYEYAEAYREEFKGKLTKTIPMPINIDEIEFKENIVNEKVIVFHGLNREGFKGTKHIRKAMELLKKKYPDEVEIIIEGKLPLNEYLILMEKTNIVIDQCKSYGYGMNALYAMAKGKVVFSGAEKETLDEFGVEESPIINILPDCMDIYLKIERFIKNKKLIKQYSEASREYVEKIHDYKMIAAKYIEIWEEKNV